MNREEPRGPWYLLTGFVFGVILGVLYARYIQPVRYVDTAPFSLISEDKDRYRSLIAVAYLSSGDLVRAKARLELLGDGDISRALTEQAQRTLARDGSSSDARALGLLAVALGQDPPGPIQSVTQDLRSPTQTQAFTTPAEFDESTQMSPITEGLSETNTASNVISPIEANSYVLISKLENCDQPMSDPIIQIEVSDQTGQPIPGILIIITWAGGEERFYTGLKPEKGLGYADYTLNQDFVYSLRIGESGAPLGNISPVLCSDVNGSSFWGVLSLKFSTP
jgi:hypothetical protein